MSWCTEHISPERRREIAEILIAESATGRVKSVEQSRSELIGLCPLHEETNPSFAYNWAKDVFNCSSGCGGGDLLKLFGLLRGLDKTEGFKIFIREFCPDLARAGRDPAPAPPRKLALAQKPPEPEPEAEPIPEAEWEKLPPLSERMLARLEDTRGWSREVMIRLDLRFIEYGGAGRVAIPIRDEIGRLMNIRMYAPGKSENKVLNAKGHGQVRLWPVRD